jgi:hypothetical protein
VVLGVRADLEIRKEVDRTCLEQLFEWRKDDFCDGCQVSIRSTVTSCFSGFVFVTDPFLDRLVGGFFCRALFLLVVQLFTGMVG